MRPSNTTIAAPHANAVGVGATLQDGLDVLDPELSRLVVQERRRQNETINLIASESYCPRATLEAESSILVSKNATGYPGRRAVAGCEIMDEIERLAQARALSLFGGEHANIQALSSTIANIAVLRGLLEPGARVLALDEAAGGHHSHGASYHLSGRDYHVTLFGLDEVSGTIDLDALRRTALELRPAMIIAGSTACPRAIDFAGLAAVAREAGALLVADIAHVAGLVAAGLHANPTACADVVTTSTHKTLCGPRTGGLILSRAAHADRIDHALFPGLQGAPGAHIIAARAALFAWAARPGFRALMQAVLDNARALAEGLREAGCQLYLGGTDTHMIVVDLRAEPGSAAAIERRLAGHGVLTNRVPLPRRPGDRGEGGLRIGTTAMTLRGMGPDDFAGLARLMGPVLKTGTEAAAIDANLSHRVLEMARAFPVPPSF
ncbi:MAG TPA: serine hydroxymethyltransferase, partial [Hyphomicrobiaceae bacterium]